MRKILIVVVALALIITSCAAAPTLAGITSIDNKDTITIRIETPFYVLDTSNFSAFLQHNPDEILYFPIKSYRILENVGDSQISLENLKSGEQIDFKQEYYKYSDISKYSTFKMELDNDYLENIYNNNFTNVLYVVFELDLYKSEIKPDALKKFEASPLEERFFACNDTYFLLQNFYSSGMKTFARINTRDLENEAFDKMISDTLDEAYYTMLEEYIKSDPNFAKVVNEINGTFKKSDRVYDKSRAIYDWIVKNIGYDKSSVSMEMDPTLKNENIPSVKNALAKRKTICVGYSYLFNALARYYGIESYVMKGIGGTEKDIKNKAQHAWNILIDENGKIIYVDSTFASSNKNNSERYFVYAPDSYFSKMHYVWSTGDKKYMPFEPKIE